jgi:hypothetical protein
MLKYKKNPEEGQKKGKNTKERFLQHHNVAAKSSF